MRLRSFLKNVLAIGCFPWPTKANPLDQEWIRPEQVEDTVVKILGNLGVFPQTPLSKEAFPSGFNFGKHGFTSMKLIHINPRGVKTQDLIDTCAVSSESQNVRLSSVIFDQNPKWIKNPNLGMLTFSVSDAI